jgi:hypothetical protein
MIKLLPYQENFILSLLLLLLFLSHHPTSHPYLISRLSRFLSLLLVIFATLINFMFLHDDDYIVIAYLLMMLQTISVIRKRWLKQHIRGGRKKSCVMKNSIGFVVLVVILPFVCSHLSTILTTNSNSAGFIWIFSIASVSDHKNKLRSGIHISHYPFELYIRVILIPRKKE